MDEYDPYQDDYDDLDNTIPKKKKPNPLLRILALLVVVAAIVAVVLIIIKKPFTRPKPEDTIARMEKSINELDIETYQSCFDESLNAIGSAVEDMGMGFLDDYSGMDISGMVDMLDSFGGTSLAADLIPKYKYTINSIEYSDKDHCVVNVTITSDYSGSMFESYGLSGADEGTMDLPMAYIDNDWKVSMSSALMGAFGGGL